MKIFLASDHAGYELKEKVGVWLRELDHEVVDLGPYQFLADDDYPDYIKLAAEELSKACVKYHSLKSVANDLEIDPDCARAIIFGYSGEGEAMVANRYPGVRATVYYGGPMDIIYLSRQHNDANTLSFGAHFVKEKEAREALELWMNTEFSGDERHIRRLKKIDQPLGPDII
ncbi:MAG: RpiB/LacA/LacB family sugar-phosphate isomerase [Candidatus Pacebacteria bacterium]|nr:RpiB/LacA/LacB family sugar-phosphate isomerase [Candidatus Paceibacterota bacterium]